MAKQTYTLTPLTGVHIGTGEELTFLDYKIVSELKDIDFKKKMYIKFSTDRILQRILNNEKAMSTFERASVSGNMRELQKFFQENCTSLKDTDYPCEITKSFLQTYNANLEREPRQNAAKVLQMYHIEGKPNPVIPGSSLKGSIRTALLNHFLDELSENDYKYGLNELEKSKGKFEERLQKKLFDYDDAKNDPLRTVSIPDCSFKSTGTQLVGGLDLISYNKKEEILESVGAQIQAEVIKGELFDGRAVSELCISIDEKLQKTTLYSGKNSFEIKKVISSRIYVKAVIHFTGMNLKMNMTSSTKM